MARIREKRDGMRTPAISIFLVINLLVYLGIALVSYASPLQVAGWVEIQLPTSMAIADFRATYGGMCLAVAVLIFQALREDAWVRPALLLIAVSCVGLPLGRVLTWAQTGELAPLMAKFMTIEAIGAAFAIWFLIRPDLRVQHGK